ncbi:MAG: hypothetical protein KDB22_18340 [Planctomycetales bacterium]|nr:hypothetical protein [Planctomycetales bacterium]
MGSIVDNIKTINSAARTLLLAALLGIIGYGGYVVYSEYTSRDRLLKAQEEELNEANAKLVSMEEELGVKAEEIGKLTVEVREQSQQIERLEASIHLLKTDHRLAQLRVVDISRDADGKALESTLEFVELSPNGSELSQPKQFTLPGDVIYVDNWIVKFDDKYIENGDIQRGTSLCLFRRIFSEEQTPNQGFSLDEVGMRPQAYARGGTLTDFESQLWSDFWEVANDGDKAGELGIRAANGEAVSIQVREGKRYNVSLRASGGLSIEPLDSTPPASSL